MNKSSNAKSKSKGASTKPKAKPSAKSRKTFAETNSTTGLASATRPMVPKLTKSANAKTAGSTPGSRSASVVPSTGVSSTPVGDTEVVKAEKQEEEEEELLDNEDDKLYCLCKTKYDENRFMIACDRCVTTIQLVK